MLPVFLGLVVWMVMVPEMWPTTWSIGISPTELRVHWPVWTSRYPWTDVRGERPGKLEVGAGFGPKVVLTPLQAERLSRFVGRPV